MAADMPTVLEIYTIGFTKKSASEFFGTLIDTGVKHVIDVRLNNTSQLAGFTKRDDLRFFLRALCDADYLHELLLAPNQDMLDDYRKQVFSWKEYERRFSDLLMSRHVERVLDRGLFAEPAVLLCSEATADRCHRRLVAEYLQSKWSGVTIRHL
jgi:uncharacterized protein (DUF488 family)